ncbi:MAG TPA: retroviral-like aspartic protease family protein [Syntrophales bacterium]|nr:retroviral-like aspartic protease family protein [Syntrophales bacterium]HPX56819.1 retroviral-like aspartic protease family protein [Syntrophales bacterium]HQA82965.1 retroviral-like aspartic protease family protein [Syntrophales bacterium]
MVSGRSAFTPFVVLLWASFFFLCQPAASMGGDLYRWVDEDGVSHYSDAPPVTPPQKGKTIQVKTLRQPSSATNTSQEFIIPFESIGQGMLVDVMINNYIPAKMLVDTGASAIKINAALLKRLNQDLPDDRRKGKVITAAGMANAEELFIEKIDVGGAVKENVRAFFMHEAYDNAYFDGLLGMSFLSDFKMTVDYKNNQIHLKR